MHAGIVLISGLAAGAGNVLLGSTDPAVSAAILAFAAGGVLAILAETIIPEAFEDAQLLIGLITVFGFVALFLIIEAQADLCRTKAKIGLVAGHSRRDKAIVGKNLVIAR